MARKQNGLIIAGRKVVVQKIIIAVLAAVLCLGVVSLAQAPADASGAGRGKLYVVGTAHLDTQWRWTIQETINEYVPATFRENFRLMDIYPNYVFSFEGAFRYMLLREYYPDEYARLKPYIDRRQWRVTGSWVDAVDVNLPSLESLVRNALYGNGYYRREFGVTSRDVFLPDCFGFGYALPSIAAHCGLKSFSSQKLSWGSSVGVPFDIGIWEGVDGSTLAAALAPGAYVAKIGNDLSRDTSWMSAVKRQGDTSGLYAAYMYFGTGDTGGSPDSASVGWLAKSMASDGPLAVQSVGADDLTDIVASADRARLPHYKGELLMTRHGVGCYSSQAAMKRWNRKNEQLADAAERASVMAQMFGGMTYPRQLLHDTWVRFLWHQFHDDLTGTSIPEAYGFSWNDEILCLNRFSQVLENAVESFAPALDTRVQGQPVIVYNPLAISRHDVVEATVIFAGKAPRAVRVYDPLGKETPSQIIGASGDSLTLLFLAEVPSVGYAVYDVRPSDQPCAMPTGLQAGEGLLENHRYTVRLNRYGQVASIADKKAQRELLAEPIALQLLHDKPDRWPAWEIQYDDVMAAPKSLLDSNAVIRIVERGPVRIGIEVTQRTGNSVFVTTVRLAASGAGERIEFASEVDWYETETLLKAAFIFVEANDRVTYDLGLGTIDRGINHEKLYEVPGHQWADMTAVQGDYGVAVLNDCKYGWDHPNNRTLRLTLIHTPGVFDSWSWVGDQKSQDKGHHTFTYAVQGHDGGWREGNVAWQAARLNQPLVAFQTTVHGGKLGKSFSLLNVQAEKGSTNDAPQVMVNAVKPAEDSDEIVIRLRELTGTPADNVRVRFARPVVAAREVNGAEDRIGPATIVDGALVTSLTPYQPKAFALTLAGDAKVQQEISKPVCRPLSLPYNQDGISTDADRRDGDFDGKGFTLSGDLMPDTLVHLDIPFVFGPASPGADNMVVCRGQTLTLPDGAFNKLYLLAASAGGPAVGTFQIDGKPTTVPIQDCAERIGQWNNRMVNGMFVEEPGMIAPAYINRAPVGWVGTHRHTPTGENEAYQFTYLFLIELDLPANAGTVVLPDNPQIRLAAATAVGTDRPDVRPARPLYDVAGTTLTQINALRNVFIDSMTVRLSTPIPGAAIRYTLDGSDPTTTSPAYTAPFILTQTTTVKVRAFHEQSDDGYINKVEFRKLIPRQGDRVNDAMPGLQCRYYEGEWRRLPAFDSLTPVIDTVVAVVALPAFVRAEDYGLVLTGYIEVPRDGLYDFSISSDDGSTLYVGDSLIVNNDGIHSEGDVTGAVALGAGRHAIRVNMFQAKGGKALDLSIAGPGLPKQLVSAAMLTHQKGN
jgi:alpha-mannosidase